MKTFVDEYGVTYSEDKKILIKGNEKLEEYTVPEGTEVIGNDDWGKMTNLNSIVLPEGLIEIGELAFSGCMGLTKLQIPSTVKEIGPYAFEFTMLRMAVIPEGVKVLNNDVFDGCFLLGSVMLPSTLERIEDHAFCSCQSTQIVLMAQERKLNYIADSAVDNSSIFLVPYELQKEYMEAFDNHSDRFFGLKILPNEGKADVYSPSGEVVGEIPVQVTKE
jgi:hypothetical protein